MARILVRLAAACCFFCLLPPPPAAQGRCPAGLQAAGGLGGRRLHLLPVPLPEPHFVPAKAAATAEEEERRRDVPVTTTKAKARPAAAWSAVRPELRAVPGGPDPLHHHGGSPSRRPEQDRTPSSP